PGGRGRAGSPGSGRAGRQWRRCALRAPRREPHLSLRLFAAGWRGPCQQPFRRRFSQVRGVLTKGTAPWLFSLRGKVQHFTEKQGPTGRLAAEGKSSLTIQFVEGQFVDSYDPTIENTFTKLITVNGQEYHLQLVDTAGQDEYSIFPQTYSIDINGYILVYSVTSIKSFEVIKVIHGKLLDMVGKVQIPIMLVGNKKDLHMERVISYEEGKALAESWNAAFLESSAKENQTAVDVFRRIILEAEKIDGAASQGKSSCSVM
uniref:GTP-binding protein Rheb n=1 Tax=Equus asinus TaxID=9793 RepID=A0A9L0JKU2_EQUAS